MVKKITAILPQKRNPNRVNVHLDGEFAFGLARITAAWLAVGQDLDQGKIDRLLAEDAGEEAYQRALRFLSYRARSQKEVIDNLKKNEIPEAVIDETVARLKANGLIDDAGFARTWLENRSEFRPRGAYALRTELRQKGIGDGFIEAALGGIDETALAFKAGRAKAAKLQAAGEQDFKRKLYGFLSRRGFNFEVIAEVVNEIWLERQRAGR
jgi:regulatory protein